MGNAEMADSGGEVAFHDLVQRFPYTVLPDEDPGCKRDAQSMNTDKEAISADDGTLSVVIPCYNEAATLASVLDAVRAAPVENMEIIVVDDASSDGSAELLEGELTGRIDRLIRHPHNRGKGAALHSGIAAARGDWVLIQDADLEYDPQDYARLLRPMVDGEADVVYGSRFHGGWRMGSGYRANWLANRFLSWFSNRFTGLGISDMETCYKVFRRELIQSLPLHEPRFGFEPEVTAALSRVPGIRLVEVPIRYDPRRFEQGKKIGWRDGIRAIWCILRYGINPNVAPGRRNKRIAD